MTFWSSIPFVRLFFALSAGILLQEYLPGSFSIHWAYGLALFFLLLVLYASAYRRFFTKLSTTIGGLVLILMVFIGWYRKDALEPAHQPTHLLNIPASIGIYKAVLAEDPQEKTNTWSFTANTLGVLTDSTLLPASGLVQVYLRRDSVAAAMLDSLRYGTVIWINNKPEEIRPPRNPGSFNFKQYMARKQILYQDYVLGEEVKVAGYAPPSMVIETSLALRRELLKILKLYLPVVAERAIAEALILGQKDEIDVEQRNAYATAGAMHILAVSGLHVGIIYMIVGFLLQPLAKSRYGKHIRTFSLLLFLWFFAFITGLSASVLRAVVMFSIVLIAEGIRRKPNIYNSLALAAWLLLLYNPNFLFQVGFQLSFLAVLGIVYLQPKLYALWDAPNLLLDRAWGITCVSIAAQLATGPLSIFYFNQFPTWFLVSNLVVIPAAFLVLSVGVVLFVTHYVHSLLATAVAFVLKWLIFSMNWFVAFVEQLPLSLIWPVSFSAFQTWVLYLGLITLLAWWATRQFKWYLYSIALAFLFTFSKLHFTWQKHRKEQLVIYEMTGYTALDYQTGGRVFHYFDDAFRKEERLYNLNVRPHLIQAGIMVPFVSHADNWLPQRSLIEDTLAVVKAGYLNILHLKNPLPIAREIEGVLEADLLLVSHNSLKTSDLNYVTVGEVVFDGTNKYGYLSRIVDQLKRQEQQVYVVPWEGAYVRQPTAAEARVDAIAIQ